MKTSTILLIGIGLYFLSQQKADAAPSPERAAGGSTGGQTNWLDVAKAFLGTVDKAVQAGTRADAQPQANP